MTPLEALRTLCATVVPSHVAGTVPTSQAAPYAVVYPAPGTPSGRLLSGDSVSRLRVFRVLAVSPTAAGAAEVAHRITTAVDTARLGPAMWLVEYVGPTILDDSDPSTALWSVTVEARIHL